MNQLEMLNIFLITIGVLTLIFTCKISHINARAFPYPSYKISYVVGIATGITISMILIGLGLRGLLLNCPPFPIEGAPPHCW